MITVWSKFKLYSLLLEKSRLILFTSNCSNCQGKSRSNNKLNTINYELYGEDINDQTERLTNTREKNCCYLSL